MAADLYDKIKIVVKPEAAEIRVDKVDAVARCVGPLQDEIGRDEIVRLRILMDGALGHGLELHGMLIIIDNFKNQTPGPPRG